MPRPDKDTWYISRNRVPVTADEILKEIVLRVAAGEQLKFIQGFYWCHIFTEDEEGNMTTHFIQSQS